MDHELIFPEFPREIWYQILSYLDHRTTSNHDLLTIAQVNKQLRSVLKNQRFWIICVNKNYKYAKFNIYNSVLESANIIHRLALFLDKKRSTFPTVCNLSKKYPTKCNLIKYRENINGYTVFPVENYINALYYVSEIQSNEYCTLALIESYNSNDLFYRTNFGYSLIKHSRAYVSSKFLKENYPDECIPLMISHTDKNHLREQGYTLYGNYIWFFTHEYDKVKFCVYNIITLENSIIYKYTGKYNSWSLTHTNKGLLLSRL